jgi:hypothetical protein
MSKEYSPEDLEALACRNVERMEDTIALAQKMADEDAAQKGRLGQGQLDLQSSIALSGTLSQAIQGLAQVRLANSFNNTVQLGMELLKKD